MSPLWAPWFASTDATAEQRTVIDAIAGVRTPSGGFRNEDGAWCLVWDDGPSHVSIDVEPSGVFEVFTRRRDTEALTLVEGLTALDAATLAKILEGAPR
jgi:hypothetical protein